MSDAVDPHLGGPGGPRTSSCATELVCRDCGYRTPLLDTAFKCPACGEGLDIDYDYERAKELISGRGLEGRPWNIWRFEELLPITVRSAQDRVGQFAGETPLIRADRLGAELGPAQPLPQGRLDQPPDALLQGPGRQHGDRPPAGARQGRGRLRLDRQRRHRGRGAGRQGRRHRLHLLPGQHGEGQGQSLPRARRPGLPARRQLRPGKPRLPRALARQRDRVRQHHPAPVLCRGGEDDGLRDGRAARLDAAGPLRHPGRRRHALLAGPQGTQRAGDRRSGRDRGLQDQHRPGRPAAARSSPRSSTATSCGRRHRRPRLTHWRSAPPGTATSSSTRSAAAVARGRPPRTRRSSRRSTCSAAPRASSPSRPAGRRSRRPRGSPPRARSALTTPSSR